MSDDEQFDDGKPDASFTSSYNDASNTTLGTKTGGGTGGHNHSSKSGDGEDREVCRNFLNGICFRGDQCKFFHPSDGRGASANAQEQIVVCRDYLNKGCRRDNCRLVHCSVQDSDGYKRSGSVSEGLARAFAAVAGPGVRTIGGRPLCKEFAAGHCRRGQDCRFWHIEVERERRMRLTEMHRAGGHGVRAQDAPGQQSQQQFNQRRQAAAPVHPFDETAEQAMLYHTAKLSSAPMSGYYDDQIQQQLENKRARYAEGYGGGHQQASYMSAQQQPQYTTSYSNTASALYDDPEILTLSEQNAVLRRRIETLKQTMSDMQAANEALLGENRRLRAKSSGMEGAGAGPGVASSGTGSSALLYSPSTSGYAPSDAMGVRWSFARTM